MCRKFHGAAFATYGEAKVEDFRWLSGEALLSSFCGHNGTLRKFCSVCGSSLIFISAQDDGQVIEFALSTLDTELGSKPSAHIYTEFKANWYDMVDDLPQFKNGR